jgi:hypothetical protein
MSIAELDIQKVRADFWKVIDQMRRPVPGFKFNREDCYDRP